LRLIGYNDFSAILPLPKRADGATHSRQDSVLSFAREASSDASTTDVGQTIYRVIDAVFLRPAGAVE